MEPLFFKAENPPVYARPEPVILASMEPLFFKAENKKTKEGRLEAHVASMEPLFFKAENVVCSSPSLNPANSLQWSRFFSKRKITRPLQQVLCGIWSFNGAAFFQSGK